MQIRFVEFTDDLLGAVDAFNQRLLTGGSTAHFPITAEGSAPLSTIHGGLVRKPFLAIDERSNMRGGYFLKFQPFSIAGQVTTLADFRMPISEGVVHTAYTQIGAGLVLDAQRRHPLLFGLGMGGYDEPVARLLRSAGWHMFSVPFYFRIVRPFSFLRKIAHLRRSSWQRILLDAAAFSGLGWAAAAVIQAMHRPRFAWDPTVCAEVVDDFDDWADAIWTSGFPHHKFSAVRNGDALRRMYPKQVKSLVRLKIARDGRPVGWAVLMNNRLSGHKYFGDIRLGSIIDCFSAPQHAVAVIRCARVLLQQQGVDLVISNQSHRIWRKALAASGFLRGPSNFIFTSSTPLTERFAADHIAPDDVHVNRGDGDGPINLE